MLTKSADRITSLLHINNGLVDPSSPMAATSKYVKTLIADEAEGRKSYRRMVFAEPGGHFGSVSMLFNSIEDAAHFFLYKSEFEWVRDAKAPDYKKLRNIRQLITRRCNDADWNERFWFEDESRNPDGSNDFIDCMSTYDIVDMRCYRHSN